ncbi:hypothetical protein DFH09DRAFT_1029688 [Mycena vulgaris]|nr:hypothetical protein DFH09DRAFT_1029688 [Mycena vulgaris]
MYKMCGHRLHSSELPILPPTKMFFSSIITPIALVPALAHSAQSCLHIVGSAAANAFSQDVSFTAVDNGVQTCHLNGGGQGNTECIAGFKLHFDYHDNPVRGPLPMTYSNPQNTYELRLPLSCFFSTGCCRTCYFNSRRCYS